MLTQGISGRRQYLTGALNGFDHTCLQEQLTEIDSKTFASPYRKSDEKEKENRKTRMAIAKFFASQ